MLESRSLDGLSTADLRRLALGGPLDALKDPIVRTSSSGWEAWICRHPLDVAGADDRMSTIYATCDDGPLVDVRYLDVLPLQGGGYRLTTRPAAPTAPTSCARSSSDRPRDGNLLNKVSLT